MPRRAGILVPLFSAPSSTSWGIGELRDVAPLARWLASGGFSRLVLLPIGTMPPGETSPYSAASAMAIDPTYVALDEVPDFERAGGREALSVEAIQRLELVSRSPTVRYEDVRPLKREALERCFDAFATEEWDRHTARAAEFATYIARQRWWLEDYALHQALCEEQPSRRWRDWAEPLRCRGLAALDEAGRRLSREILRQQYWQWIAESQWQDTRLEARRHGVSILGDLAFVTGGDSTEVWVHQHEFDFDVSVGAPPDAFAADGQDWNLPCYRWDVLAASDYDWFRRRIRRMAALYDGVRIDHVVGLYRTYARPRDGQPYFTPATEHEQVVQGEAVLRLFLDSPLHVVAEDLGTVPDFVRQSLSRLGIAGCRVLRWERRWHEAGRPFIDPATYRATSMAMSGTHDTETMASWWHQAPADDRRALLALPFLRRFGFQPVTPWSTAVRDALLEQLYRAGSDDLVLPIQDVFGWADRINTPGTISGLNWRWRLPWPVDALTNLPEPSERAATCARLARDTGRA